MHAVGATFCTRAFIFDAGHRVVGHKGKCRHLHGHTYKAEVTCVAPFTDKLGMVIDFSEIKSRVGGWIEQVLDHNLVLNPRDPFFAAPLTVQHSLHGRIPFVMPADFPNPTAENIARVILEKACEILAPVGIVCNVVKLWETPSCHAEYYHPGWLSGELASKFVVKEIQNAPAPAPAG